MKKLIQILAPLAVGSNVLLWTSEIAYLQRGYKAIGGEYIAAILAAIVVEWLTEKLL